MGQPKGCITWNKGKTGIYTKEVLENLRQCRLGIKLSERTKKRMSESHKGKKHWNWKGGKTINSKGYIFIYASEHPSRDCLNHIFEHRYIMEQKLKRYLNPEERIHHINGNKQDNRIENLMLFKNESEHQKFHYANNILSGKKLFNKDFHYRLKRYER